MTQPIRYRLIDCFKGIACLAVVLIHFNLPEEAGVVAKAMMTFAVPYFFFVSGFFMPDRNLMLHRSRTWKKLKHILALIAGSAVFYLIFTPVWNDLMYKTWEIGTFTAKEMTLPSLLKLFLTCDPFVYGHLWYLFALVYCYLIFMIADGQRVSDRLLAAAVPLMIAFFIMAEFRDLFGINVFRKIPGSEETLCYPNMPIFRALPLFMFGMVMRRNETAIRERFSKVPDAVFLVIMVLGCLCAVAEQYNMEISQYYLGTMVTCFTMAVYSISHPQKGIRVLEFIGSKLSLYVYILHTAAGKMVDLIIQKVLHLGWHPYYKWGRWLMAMVASLCTAWVVHVIFSQMKGIRAKKALQQK